MCVHYCNTYYESMMSIHTPWVFVMSTGGRVSNRSRRCIVKVFVVPVRSVRTFVVKIKKTQESTPCGKKHNRRTYFYYRAIRECRFSSSAESPSKSLKASKVVNPLSTPPRPYTRTALVPQPVTWWREPALITYNKETHINICLFFSRQLGQL